MKRWAYSLGRFCRENRWQLEVIAILLTWFLSFNAGAESAFHETARQLQRHPDDFLRRQWEEIIIERYGKKP